MSRSPPTEEEESKRAVEFHSLPSIEAKERFRLKEYFGVLYAESTSWLQKEGVRRSFLCSLAKLDKGLVTKEIIREVDDHLGS